MFTNGFTDLVSVIPPGAKLTPSSKIPQAQVGKVPGKRLPNGLWVGYNWRKENATAEDVHGWMTTNEPANVGVRADNFPGVDVDVTDPDLAEIIEQEAIAFLGVAPVRIGKPPKRLLMYRTDEPFGRMRLWFDKEGVHHLVEVLGQGQQYLVHGIHPQTLQPYTWDEDLAGYEAADLTLLTRARADAFLTKLCETLTLLGLDNITREGDGRPITHAAGEQTALRAPSLDLLREAVRKIPNTNETFPDRTSYLKMGYAVRAAGAEDLDEAYNIFSEWAASWEGNARADGNDPATVLGDWRRMRGDSSVGWNWVAEQARPHGFDTTALDFEALDERPSDKPTGAPRLSDQWLADRVVAAQRGNLRFVPQKGQFLAWSQTRWQPDAELLAEDIVKRELRAIANEIGRQGATEKEQAGTEKAAVAICASAKVPAIAMLVKSDRAIAVTMAALDHDPWVLNTPGGLVDLRTGVLGPAVPDALATKSTTVPPDFSGPATRWFAFLDEATGGDADLQAYLQRLCGYLLTGSTREQQLTFIFGPGGNGKSVFLNVLSGILGDYSRTASMDTFTASHSEKHTTDVAMLTGARLVTASETAAGKRWDEPRLKSLTGGEPVTARFMRQDNFTFTPQFKLVFVGNHKPEIRDVDAAMRRRIQMVPFVVTPKVVDKELSLKLLPEYPAILAWMIRGCLEWQAKGLASPVIVQETTEAYFEAEDAVGRWVRECLVAVSGQTITSQTLYLSWREWSNQNGEHTGSLKRLSAAMIARRFERWQDPKTRKLGFTGITLLEQDPLLGVLG
jgi:putative DNA primase/helicase